MSTVVTPSHLGMADWYAITDGGAITVRIARALVAGEDVQGELALNSNDDAFRWILFEPVDDQLWVSTISDELLIENDYGERVSRLELTTGSSLRLPNSVLVLANDFAEIISSNDTFEPIPEPGSEEADHAPEKNSPVVARLVTKIGTIEDFLAQLPIKAAPLDKKDQQSRFDPTTVAREIKVPEPTSRLNNTASSQDSSQSAPEASFHRAVERKRQSPLAPSSALDNRSPATPTTDELHTNYSEQTKVEPAATEAGSSTTKRSHSKSHTSSQTNRTAPPPLLVQPKQSYNRTVDATKISQDKANDSLPKRRFSPRIISESATRSTHWIKQVSTSANFKTIKSTAISAKAITPIALLAIIGMMALTWWMTEPKGPASESVVQIETGAVPGSAIAAPRTPEPAVADDNNSGRVDRAEGLLESVEDVLRTEQRDAATLSFAIQAYETALSLNPNNAAARGRLDELNTQLASLSQIAVADPVVPEPVAIPKNYPQLATAKKYLIEGRIISPREGNAVALINQVLYQDPTHPTAINLLNEAADQLVERARAAYILGEEYEARNILEEVLAFHPRHPAAGQLWQEWVGRPVATNYR